MTAVPAVLLVDAGLLVGFLGIVAIVKPLRFLGMETRLAGAGVFALGLCLAIAGVSLPAPLLHPAGDRARLDDFVSDCQFRELHTIRVHAPPDDVYRAIKAVTAREIRFFRLLTWIRSPRLRRAGRQDILAAPADKPLLDVALRSGFLLLAEEPDREIVFGTILCGRLPAVTRVRPGDFTALDRPGFCKVAMNFRLREEAGGWVRLSTETRVLALDASARRKFAAYWRVISPGSTLIRRMWLEAIRRRAENARVACAEELKAFILPVDQTLQAYIGSGSRDSKARNALDSIVRRARIHRQLGIS